MPALVVSPPPGYPWEWMPDLGLPHTRIRDPCPACFGPSDHKARRYPATVTAEPVPIRGPGWRRAAVVAAWIGLAGAGALTCPFGWAATALVVSVAVVVVVRATVRRSNAAPLDRRLRNGLILWSGLVTSAVTWELFALARQPEWHRPSPSEPTLSTLLDPALEQGPWRLVGWLVWLAAGWRLLR